MAPTIQLLPSDIEAYPILKNRLTPTITKIFCILIKGLKVCIVKMAAKSTTKGASRTSNTSGDKYPFALTSSKTSVTVRISNCV